MALAGSLGLVTMKDPWGEVEEVGLLGGEGRRWVGVVKSVMRSCLDGSRVGLREGSCGEMREVREL